MYENGSTDRCSTLLVFSSLKSNITYSNVSPQSPVENFMVTDLEYIVSMSLFMNHYTRCQQGCWAQVLTCRTGQLSPIPSRCSSTCSWHPTEHIQKAPATKLVRADEITTRENSFIKIGSWILNQFLRRASLAVNTDRSMGLNFFS